MIAPQAGDVWKCTVLLNRGIPAAAHTQSVTYFVHEDYFKREPFWFVCKDGFTQNISYFHNVEDGKNGWELVWREGWMKVNKMDGSYYWTDAHGSPETLISNQII